MRRALMDEDQPWQDDWTDSDREFPTDDLVEWETNEVYKDIELERQEEAATDPKTWLSSLTPLEPKDETAIDRLLETFDDLEDALKRAHKEP